MLISFDINNIPVVHLIGHSICLSGWKLPYRIIGEYELIIPFHGSVAFIIGNTEHIINEGECLVLSPYIYHNAYIKDGSTCRFYYVHFVPGSNVEQISEESASRHINELNESLDSEKDLFFISYQYYLKKVYLLELFSLGVYKDEVFSIFEKALAERNKFALNSMTVISLYMSQIFLLLTRIILNILKIEIYHSSNGKIPKVLQEILFYINEKYQQKITISEFSKHFDLSSQYIIRMFNKYLGMSPLLYINNLRISRAKKLMRYTTMSSKQISYEIGFENPHYFSTLFKKIEGVSPTEYREGFNCRSNE